MRTLSGAVQRAGAALCAALAQAARDEIPGQPRNCSAGRRRPRCIRPGCAPCPRRAGSASSAQAPRRYHLLHAALPVRPVRSRVQSAPPRSPGWFSASPAEPPFPEAPARASPAKELQFPSGSKRRTCAPDTAPGLRQPPS